MMKRSIIFLLILTLVVSTFLVGCTNDNEEVETPDDGEEVVVDDGDDMEEEDDDADVSGRPAEPMGQITIGNTTELSGDWIPYFQNNAADYDVYNFIQGYGTVDMTFEGEYVVNETVVKDYERIEEEDGSTTYVWTINENLEYDDGTPITAVDYVAAPLFWSSKQLGDMGAKNDYGYYYKGWEAYSRGEAQEFTGVRLLDDYQFSITIDEKHLPYFYELPNVSVGPLPLAFWTDDTIEVLDDGNGAYLSDNFTAEAYKDHVNATRGAIYPSTGPYKLKSYDESTKTAVLEINDNYLGDYTGQKPSIQTIIYKKVNQETSLDELATGSVDLLTGMASGDEINAGLDLVDDGGFAFTTYPRSGYGKLTLVCDHGPTQFVEVRQALNHLIDRNEFAKAFTGGHGSVVNGPYGESMWFYQETKAELNDRVNQYPYSLDNAVALLEEGGWVLDANGNDYTEGIRYKQTEDGELMPLEIEWASSENNAVSDLLVVNLQENPDVAAAGMKINQTVMTFPELLNYLYRDGSEDPKYSIPEYSMFNLATNFTSVYDQSRTYTTDPDMIKQGYNDNFIIDEELEALSIEMVKKDPMDKDGFKETFVDFIARWNYLTPDVPLYSNIYHDFYNEKLENYNMNSLVRVDKALLYSYVTE